MELQVNYENVPGQEEAKKSLRELAASARLPHALMLSGPAGAGKMLLARAYAKALHCENPSDGEACGRCRSCRLHDDNSHPDLHFVYPIVKSEKLKRTVSDDVAEQWREMLANHPAMPEEKWLEILDAGNSQPAIYVNEADKIVRSDAYPPYVSPYKIFIIWLPERMRVEAANKLLKVLEEPSEGTLFILVCDNELGLLPTIFSRVRRLRVGRFSDAQIASYLQERYGFGAQAAFQYAPLCGGSLIPADEFGTHTGESEIFLATYQEIMRAAYSKRVALLKSIAERVAGFGREKIRRFLLYMARMIRENFIYNMRVPGLSAMTPGEEAFSTKFSPFVNHSNVEDFALATDEARRDIERNGNARLILFDYFIRCIILLHRKPKNTT